MEIVKHRKLNDALVIELREAARANGDFDLTIYAQKTGASLVTLGSALRGTSFVHLNNTYPPVNRSGSKLNDTAVIALRNAARENPNLSLTSYEEAYGVKTPALCKAIRGVNFRHLNAKHPPVLRGSEKLSEAFVINLRKMVREDPTFSFSRYAKEQGVVENTLREAVSGETYSRLNATAPPVVFDRSREKDKVKVRELYAKKHTTKEITDLTGVSASTIWIWCKDLIEQRQRDIKENGMSCYNSRTRRRLAITEYLKDEDVIAIRRDVKLTGKKSLKRHAATYKVSACTIGDAIRGRTFKHLDATEPPVTKRLSPDRGNSKAKWQVPEDLIREAMGLMRSDPSTWSYAKLAEWLNEKTGRQYQAPHMARMFINRDPSIKALKSDTPKRLSDEQKALKKAKRFADALALRKMIEEENRREEWIAAGCPENWAWE